MPQKIDIPELQQKLQKINEYINTNHSDKTRNERVLLKAAKLPEEVWEFYNELLISLGFTRKWKEAQSEVEKELADVIITSLIIAQELEIDIFSHIEQKINTVYTRFNLDK